MVAIIFASLSADGWSEEEADFPVAFSLIVYRYFDQVEQLLSSIYRSHNLYCFHVDTSADSLFKEQVSSFSRTDNDSYDWSPIAIEETSKKYFHLFQLSKIAFPKAETRYDYEIELHKINRSTLDSAIWKRQL